MAQMHIDACGELGNVPASTGPMLWALLQLPMLLLLLSLLRGDELINSWEQNIHDWLSRPTK